MIAKDRTTFMEGVKPGSYPAFSLDGGEIVYDAPEGWTDTEQLKAVTLTKDGDGTTVPCVVKDGKIRLNMTADVPVRVTKH